MARLQRADEIPADVGKSDLCTPTIQGTGKCGLNPLQASAAHCGSATTVDGAAEQTAQRAAAARHDGFDTDLDRLRLEQVLDRVEEVEAGTLAAFEAAHERIGQAALDVAGGFFPSARRFFRSGLGCVFRFHTGQCSGAALLRLDQLFQSLDLVERHADRGLLCKLLFESRQFQRLDLLFRHAERFVQTLVLLGFLDGIFDGSLHFIIVRLEQLFHLRLGGIGTLGRCNHLFAHGQILNARLVQCGQLRLHFEGAGTQAFLQVDQQLLRFGQALASRHFQLLRGDLVVDRAGELLVVADLFLGALSLAIAGLVIQSRFLLLRGIACCRLGGACF